MSSPYSTLAIPGYAVLLRVIARIEHEEEGTSC
jgi:hypothetical protein